MHPRRLVPAALLRLAELQSGVVTREQARGHGLSTAVIARLVRQGSWLVISRGVYLVAPVLIAPVEPSWPAWVWAGVLIGGDEARVGGQAAAHLHGFCPEPPAVIEILVPARGPRPTVTGPWAFRRECVGVRSTRSVGLPPRLTVEDTVLDLVDAARSAETVAHWVTAAVQERRTTAARLSRAAAGRRRLRHRRLVTGLLDDVAAGARSPLEVRYLHDVERAHQIPVGRRQDRQRRTEVDVWYDEYALLVELDGRLGHEGVGRFRDMRRDNAALLDGMSTLRFGHADVLGSPCEVAFQVAAALAARGWSGPVQRCGRCLRVA